MLRKLLKYDLKAMFRYWWIAAVVSLLMSTMGGFSLLINNIDRPVPEGLLVVTSLLSAMAFLSYTVMFVLSMVLIFLRFYRNFFTDEGYLTFTLPVHRHTLLNSKIISGMLLFLATTVVIGGGFFLMLAIVGHEYVFSVDFLKDIEEFFVTGMERMGIYFPVYILEAILLWVLSCGIFLMLLYTCITFGSVIAKKGKVIASIAIFYGSCNALSLMLFLSMILCIPNISYWMRDLTDKEGYPLIALILLAIILLEALLCMVMYTLQYRMLKRKLNLS
jgi:hypothetical protein